MAFPTTAVLDNFNRADGSPPSGWSQPLYTGDGNITINTNQLALSTGTAANGWLDGATYGPDCEVYCTIPTLPSDGNPTDLFARVADPGTATPDGYQLRQWQDASQDYFEVRRIDNGVGTTLGATINQTFAAGDSFGMSIVGSTIEVWYKPSAGAWTSLGTRTDGTYGSAGYLGIQIWFGTVRVDDFGGGTIAAAGTRRDAMLLGVG